MIERRNIRIVKKAKKVFDWSKIPENINFISKEKDGLWYGWKNTPLQINDGWDDYKTENLIPLGRCEDFPEIDWKKSVQKRP